MARSPYANHAPNLRLAQLTRWVLLAVLAMGSPGLGQARQVSKAEQTPGAQAARPSASWWLAQAKRHSEHIDSPITRAEVSAMLAGTAAKLGDDQAYHRDVGQAIALALSQPAGRRHGVQWALAISHAKAGHNAQAMITAESNTRPYFVISAFADISQVFMDRGDQAAAKRALDRAITAYTHAEQAFTKRASLFKLTQALAQADRFDTVAQLAEGSASPARAAEALAHSAAIAGRSGNDQWADDLLGAAKEKLNEAKTKAGNQAAPNPPEALAQAQAAVVGALACQGQMSRAVDLAKTLTDHSESAAIAWAAIAQSRSQAGDSQPARQAWNHARNEVETMERAYRRAWLWQHLVKVGMRARLIDQPRQLVEHLPTPLERAVAALTLAESQI